MKKSNTTEVGRSAITGRFITVDDAKKNSRTAIVQHVPRATPKLTPTRLKKG